MNQNQKNPNEYGYMGDEVITMTAQEFAEMKGAIDFFLEKETKFDFPELYKYVNRDTGELIKTVTEKNKDVAVKVVDVEGTLNAKPRVYRTQEGINLLKVKLLTEKIHMNMVESGVAKHKSFFEKQNLDAPLGETIEGTEE